MPHQSTRRTPNKIDLTGRRFSRLEVIREAPRISRDQGVRWLCRCDCGNETVVESRCLRTGATRSCGCYHREVMSAWCKVNKHRHGHAGTKLYRRWHGMVQRCCNPNNPRHKDYGGRGIKMCEPWLASFENFLADMGQPPGPGYTLERIDNDGDYEPGNVRWALWAEQARNTRANTRITIDGETRILAQWLIYFDMPMPTYVSRLKRGMSQQDALTKPVDAKMSRGRSGSKAT